MITFHAAITCRWHIVSTHVSLSSLTSHVIVEPDSGGWLWQSETELNTQVKLHAQTEGGNGAEKNLSTVAHSLNVNNS